MSSSNGKKVFGREDILAAKEKRNVIRIDDVPGLDGSIFIWELKRSEFVIWLESLIDSDSKPAASILCDESGTLLYDAKNPDDIREIEDSLTAKQLGYIVKKGVVENSANVQLAEKNWQASLSTPSSSVSPPT